MLNPISWAFPTGTSLMSEPLDMAFEQKQPKHIGKTMSPWIRITTLYLSILLFLMVIFARSEASAAIEINTLADLTLADDFPEPLNKFFIQNPSGEIFPSFQKALMIQSMVYLSEDSGSDDSVSANFLLIRKVLELLHDSISRVARASTFGLSVNHKPVINIIKISEWAKIFESFESKLLGSEVRQLYQSVLSDKKFLHDLEQHSLLIREGSRGVSKESDASASLIFETHRRYKFTETQMSRFFLNQLSEIWEREYPVLKAYFISHPELNIRFGPRE